MITMRETQKEREMDFRQEKLSGFTHEEFDGEGNLLSRTVTDFTVYPWQVQEFDGAGDLVAEYTKEREPKLY